MTDDKFYSPALVQEVEALITAVTAKEKGTITAWGDVMKILTRENIPYKTKQLATGILVHKDNRGKLGLNPFNVHRNLSMIKRSGAPGAFAQPYIV